MKKLGLALAFAIVAAAGSYVFAQEQQDSDSMVVVVEQEQENVSKDSGSARQSDLKVSDSAVCTAIADRQPEGASAEFSRDIEKVYYWTRIEGA
ncbi:MAG: hypothetical protein FWC88_00190, partial [Endomicrobia bacterium]|nr:hypothetical protein [Endomicrobiia bacterium]